MSDKRKKRKFAVKRETRRLKKLAEGGRLVKGVEIPVGAVSADPTQQAPSNSYAPPTLFYVDKEFVCVDCGQTEIWSAQQQKWYYEVAKGSLYATAIRCRECRRRRLEQRQGHGDPNPIKHVGSLMKRIRSTIEPGLVAAGFELDGRKLTWLDYSRPGLMLRCRLESRTWRLVAETLDGHAAYQVIAMVDLSTVRSAWTLPERVDDFSSAVTSWVQSLPTASGAALP